LCSAPVGMRIEHYIPSSYHHSYDPSSLVPRPSQCCLS